MNVSTTALYLVSLSNIVNSDVVSLYPYCFGHWFGDHHDFSSRIKNFEVLVTEIFTPNGLVDFVYKEQQIKQEENQEASGLRKWLSCPSRNRVYNSSAHWMWARQPLYPPWLTLIECLWKNLLQQLCMQSFLVNS